MWPQSLTSCECLLLGVDVPGGRTKATIDAGMMKINKAVPRIPNRSHGTEPLTARGIPLQIR